MRRAMCIAAAALALAGVGAGSAQAAFVREPTVTASSVPAAGRGAITVPANLVIPRPATDRDVLINHTYLCAGLGIWLSTNNRARLIMQSDGNLVLYKDGRAVWQTGTVGRGTCAVWQPDGNFVLYGHSGEALWASHTEGRGYYFAVQDDGNVVIYDQAGRPLWATYTNG